MHLRPVLILAVLVGCSRSVPEQRTDAGPIADASTADVRLGARAIPFIPRPHDGSAPVVAPDAKVPWIDVTPANAAGQGIPKSWVQVIAGPRLGHRAVWVDPDAGLTR
jgi:hypothetical protein